MLQTFFHQQNEHLTEIIVTVSIDGTVNLAGELLTRTKKWLKRRYEEFEENTNNRMKAAYAAFEEHVNKRIKQAETELLNKVHVQEIELKNVKLALNGVEANMEEPNRQMIDAYNQTTSKVGRIESTIADSTATYKTGFDQAIGKIGGCISAIGGLTAGISSNTNRLIQYDNTVKELAMKAQEVDTLIGKVNTTVQPDVMTLKSGHSELNNIVKRLEQRVQKGEDDTDERVNGLQIKLADVESNVSTLGRNVGEIKQEVDDLQGGVNDLSRVVNPVVEAFDGIKKALI